MQTKRNSSKKGSVQKTSSTRAAKYLDCSMGTCKHVFRECYAAEHLSENGETMSPELARCCPHSGVAVITELVGEGLAVVMRLSCMRHVPNSF